MFVAKVVGHSMEPRIPNNSYCIFSANVVGSRQNKIVLAQHNEISDMDTMSSYTVKQYKSEKAFKKDGTWKHEKIVLEPLNEKYDPIVLSEDAKDEFRIVAEFIEVL